MSTHVLKEPGRERMPKYFIQYYVTVIRLREIKVHSMIIIKITKSSSIFHPCETMRTIYSPFNTVELLCSELTNGATQTRSSPLLIFYDSLTVSQSNQIKLSPSYTSQ